jgi:hypothetical protein
MSCSGSHLGITINIKNTKFVKDLPMIEVFKVILVGTGVQLKLRKHPNAYIAI